MKAMICMVSQQGTAGNLTIVHITSLTKISTQPISPRWSTLAIPRSEIPATRKAPIISTIPPSIKDNNKT